MFEQSKKLDKGSRAELRRLRAELDMAGGVVFPFPDMGVTVACMPKFPGSRMWEFSVAVASIEENKFRPKVGALLAILRLFNGDSMPANVGEPSTDASGMSQQEYAGEKAYELARFVA